jgi:uncharacterized coiled-coil protein SlyX
MAEVSRSRNRVDRLGAEIDKRDAMLAERDSEIARLKDQVAALVSELEARTEALHQLQEEHGWAARRTPPCARTWPSATTRSRGCAARSTGWARPAPMPCRASAPCRSG